METVGTPAHWAGFIALVLALLALDLGVLNRRAHVISIKEAARWSVVWVSISLLFNLVVWWQFGGRVATEFLSGYLIEKSLAVDNLFVFVVVFASLGVPPRYQHRVLFWGILGALVMRAAMIVAGVAALERFHWMIYVFGGLLVFTGYRLYRHRDESDGDDGGGVIRFFRRIIPTTSKLEDGRFFARENGRRVATPLLLALACIEVADVIFAVDSIPAIFAVTRDPFIVFTSNVFAILGLRSMYFLLAGSYAKFTYLKVGLAFVLAFVGVKMMLIDIYPIPAYISLTVIMTMLGASIGYSLYRASRPAESGSPDRPA